MSFLNSSFSRWTRELIYDFGKSGTDDETYYTAEYKDDCSLPGNEDNPEFGVDPHNPESGAICAETASWYFARYAYTCDKNLNPDCYSYYVDNFTDRTYAGSFAKWFLDESRLYCSRVLEPADTDDPNEHVWQKCLVREKNNDDEYECVVWEDSFITPVEGDLLFWPNYGHVSMTVYWDPAIIHPGASNERTELLYGSNLKIARINSREFYVGRIPDNDGL